MLAGVLVAFGLAPLSVYVVLRRIVFVGAAVAEISSAGVALAILFQPRAVSVALVLTILTFLGFSRAADNPRLPLEALIGMLYAGGSAAAVLLIVKVAARRGRHPQRPVRQHSDRAAAAALDDGVAFAAIVGLFNISLPRNS